MNVEPRSVARAGGALYDAYVQAPALYQRGAAGEDRALLLQAREAVGAAIRQGPDVLELYALTSAILMELGELEEARHTAARLFLLCSDHLQPEVATHRLIALHTLAEIAIEECDYGIALQTLEHARGMPEGADPYAVERVFTALALVYQELGRPGKAREVAEEGIRQVAGRGAREHVLLDGVLRNLPEVG